MFALLVGVFPAQAQELSDLLGRINALRAAHGLPALALNGALGVAAQQQAQWIVDNRQISHTHPDGSGPRTRALNAGYPSTNVGENIYGGTNATANDAWTFWMNSAIHFNTMISPYFNEIGIGIARGSWGAAYVFVFGGANVAPVTNGNANRGGAGSAAAAPAGPPAYVGGLDEHGNIKHIVQSGDTLGDIALIYGYTWSDLPYMMELNGLTNVRDLEVGSIFLVPPKAGTYTPTPGDSPATEAPAPTEAPPTVEVAPLDIATATPELPAVATTAPEPLIEAPTATPALPLDASPDVPTATLAISPTSAIATAGANVAPPEFGDDPTPGVTEIAALVTADDLRVTSADAPAPQPRSSIQTWIVVALVMQVVIVVGAGIEFGRRALRKRSK